LGTLALYYLMEKIMLRIARYFLVVLFASVSPLAMASGISYVSVETQGTGESQNFAIASALSAAISQVNGATLESEKVLSELMVAVDTESDSQAMSASSSAEVVSQKTKGTVRDYKVLSSQEQDGLWTVVVASRIAKFERSVQSDRLRISVLPFRVDSDSFMPSADKFATDLAALLTQSRRFAVLDRDFEEERQLEMTINTSEDSPTEEMARLGNRLGTDLMVVGTIQDASISTRSTELAGRTLHSATGHFAVSYRIIDAATGQVKFADSWSRTREGASLDSLVSAASEAIGRQIVDGIFPIAVESVSGDLLYLGQGGKSIKTGQKYRLIQLGDAIVDSYTGESLGRQERDVGLIEIIDVQSKVTKARLLKSDVDIAEVFAPAVFVVRLHSESTSQHSSTSPAPPREPPAKSVKEIKEDLESSW